MDLSDNERKVLIGLFLQYALKQPHPERGKVQALFMRNRRIWISEKKFLEKTNQPKIIKSLIAKNILTVHPILGYQFFIKEAFVEKIYRLADHGDLTLLTQLAGIWIEPMPS